MILALELKLSKTWLIISTSEPPSLSDITLTSEIKNIFTGQLMAIFYLWAILTWLSIIQILMN